MAEACSGCGTTKADSYGGVGGSMVCQRCTFISLAGLGAVDHSNCPPLPPPEGVLMKVHPWRAKMEALEATVDAFLESPQCDRKTHDELTDSLAQAFAAGEGEAANAMETMLKTVLLPLNKMVRIHGLTGARASELNGRVGILMQSPARVGQAPISLVPSETADGEWVNVKFTALQPASVGLNRIRWDGMGAGMGWGWDERGSGVNGVEWGGVGWGRVGCGAVG